MTLYYRDDYGEYQEADSDVVLDEAREYSSYVYDKWSEVVDAVREDGDLLVYESWSEVLENVADQETPEGVFNNDALVDALRSQDYIVTHPDDVEYDDEPKRFTVGGSTLYLEQINTDVVRLREYDAHETHWHVCDFTKEGIKGHNFYNGVLANCDAQLPKATNVALANTITATGPDVVATLLLELRCMLSFNSGMWCATVDGVSALGDTPFNALTALKALIKDTVNV